MPSQKWGCAGVLQSGKLGILASCPRASAKIGLLGEQNLFELKELMSSSTGSTSRPPDAFPFD